ncbi:hypothetical protein BDE36_1374 [Arcticibacter tournemirensis]|uniref:Uncharacterized protein n=1 Tax=Arcticibacter tournemirensis TaxID=699437 RepID=A0A5M9GJX2_9SPHI|nr:hypothetical protein [Arcticibacter tournemirensis]KAA8474826.1 hypothetical protein F1649_21885 [Arcticibacter tournemirensis]TQM49649.1 hypothetical protein BDE36_1374 [Arcticibacter tournemirensis]
MAVHIGRIIYYLVKEKGLKAKAIADFVNVSQSSLFKIYKRESIDLDKLIRFSQLLNKNLFLYYLDEEPIKSMFGKEGQALQKQILELENEVALKNEKLKDMAEIIEAQKKIISLYEAKSDNNKKIKKKL